MAERPDGETYCAYVSVEVNGNPLPRHYWGSSHGVEWGYLGSGPEALAYDLLAFEYDETLARNHLHSFTEGVVAQFPRYVSAEPGPHLEWSLTAAQMQEWLQEQGRPEPIRVYVPQDMWEDWGSGTPVSTVYARFLPDRRLVLGLELLNTSPMGYRQVVSAKEQELRTSPEGWLIWYDARAVDPSEYQLYRY
jgi:hypothetical protein